MGITKSTPAATTEGKMARRASAAAAALGLPPSRQSWNVNRLCLTGLLKEIRAESTKVMWRTPQAIKERATAQPSVPAPVTGRQDSATGQEAGQQAGQPPCGKAHLKAMLSTQVSIL